MNKLLREIEVREWIEEDAVSDSDNEEEKIDINDVGPATLADEEQPEPEEH